MMYYLIIKITKGVTMKLTRKAYKFINDWFEITKYNKTIVLVQWYAKYYRFIVNVDEDVYYLEIPESEVIEFDFENEDNEYISVKDINYAD